MQRTTRLPEFSEGAMLFSLKDITYTPAPRKNEPFTVKGKVELFGMPFFAPIWVVAKVTYPEKWWEEIIPIWGSPTVGESQTALGGDFEIKFPRGFEREGEFLLNVEVHAGPTFTVDKMTIPPFPPMASEEMTFVVGGEVPPEEVGFRTFRILSYSKNGGPPVTPPGVLELDIGDRCRVNVGFDHMNGEVTGKFHAAIWQKTLIDPHDEILNAERTFIVPPSPDWQPFEDFIDIPITSAISPGSEYGLYVKIMGITGGDIFTEYLSNVITIVGVPPEEAEFELTRPTSSDEYPEPGTDITITCPVTSRCAMPVDARAKVIIYEGSILPGHGDIIKEYESDIFHIEPDESQNVIIHHTTVEGTIDRRDVEVEIYIDTQLVKESEWDDVYYVGRPPEEVIDFDLTKPTVSPAEITPGTAITITCPVTSACTKEQTATATVKIYEGSILPGHGDLIRTYTSPPFTISPDESYNVIISHTAVAGTIDRRDAEVEVYIAGKLVKESEWDDVYFVTAPPTPPTSDIKNFDFRAQAGTYDLGDSVPFDAPYEYKGKAQDGWLTISLGTGVYPSFFTKHTFTRTRVSFDEAMDWTSGRLTGSFTLPAALEAGQTYNVRAKLETDDGKQETDTDWGVIKITEVAEEYTLSVTIEPPGAGRVTKSPDKPRYAAGERVTLTASPYSGYEFDRWSGDVSGYSTSVTVVMDRDKGVKANFKAVYPTSDIKNFDFRAQAGTYDLGDSVPYEAPYEYKGKAQSGWLTISLGTGVYPSFFTKHTFTRRRVSFDEAMNWTSGRVTGSFTLPTTLEAGQTYNVRAKLETDDGKQETDTDWGVIKITEEVVPPPAADIKDFDFRAQAGTYAIGDRVSFNAPYKYKGMGQSGRLVIELGTGIYPTFSRVVSYSPMPVEFDEAIDWESRSLEGTFLLTAALEPGRTYSVRAKLETLTDYTQETDTDWGVLTIETAPPVGVSFQISIWGIPDFGLYDYWACYYWDPSINDFVGTGAWYRSYKRIPFSDVEPGGYLAVFLKRNSLVSSQYTSPTFVAVDGGVYQYDIPLGRVTKIG